jgi:hypothetical protein
LNGKDAWVVKTDTNGDLDWNLTFAGATFAGSSVEDVGRCIIQTSDGGYALVGTKDDKTWLAKISPSTNPASIWFPAETAAIVAAAIIVIVIAAVIVRKRRQQKKSQQQHLREHSTLKLEFHKPFSSSFFLPKNT